MIEHVKIGIIEEEVYGISSFTIWESLASKDNAVTGKASFKNALSTIDASIMEFRDNIRSSILMKGFLQIGFLSPSIH